MPPHRPAMLPAPGARLVPGGCSFTVVSGGTSVELCLVEDGGERLVPALRHGADLWHVEVAGAGVGTRYAWRAHGPSDPARGQRYDPACRLVDPYTRAVDDAGWSVVVDESFDWGDDRPPLVPWADTVVYEAHVRGLTRCHPALPEELRGTYAGLAHPDTLGHLLDLGVTTVELLPVHHFASEPALTRRGATNYWGYSSLAFFAPHGPYAAAGQGGEQVAEFKAMVRDLHAAGLEVVLDVVYNHTAEGGADGPTLSLRGLHDEAYYRRHVDGSYVDTTGCGNSLDLRHHRTLRLVTDSLRYWVEEMHVDGFRFDLAPTLARGAGGFDKGSAFLAVLAQDPVLSGVKLVAEPWDVAGDGYQLGSFPPPWAEWNDRFRSHVRDAWLAHRGRGSGHLRDLAYRLSGSSDVFAASGRGPLSSVNFVTAHDGFTLHDLVSYDRKHNEANGEQGRDGSDDNRSWSCGVEGPTDDADVLALRRRMMRSLLATLLVSTGVPMLTAGDETGRTQRGNNNAYCLDDETAWVSWDHAPWQRDLFEWTKALLRLRREHRVLRHDDFFDGRPADDAGVKDLAWFGADGAELTAQSWHEHGRQVLAMYLTGLPDGSQEAGTDALLVALNTGRSAQHLRLPGEPWSRGYAVLLDTADERPIPGARHEPGAPLELDAHTLVVLAVTR